ncbi:MAG: hypothetical protein M5U26_25555 [Planctomycetota bacterium]|nr:hypothetical protein [Planctomycetota bacterium]
MIRMSPILGGILAFAAAAGALRGGEDEDPSPAPEVVVNDVFNVADRANLWHEAQRRALLPLTDSGGLAPRTGGMMVEGFLSGKGVRTEMYSGGSERRELLLELRATDAERRGKAIYLSTVRLTYFLSEGSLQAISQALQHGGSNGSGKAAAPALPAQLRQGRVAITAKDGRLNLETAEGEAGGGVVVEIFSQAITGDASIPVGVLSCEKLRWRSWRDPVVGSTELVLFVLSERRDVPDPLVRGRFVARNPDGGLNTMDIQAEGMILETGTRDDPRPVEVDGKRVGVTAVERRRVIFHRNIQMLIEGSGAALMPFQENPRAPEAAEPKGPPVPPTRTEVTCQGPAVLDMAVLPHVVAVTQEETHVPWRGASSSSTACAWSALRRSSRPARRRGLPGR